MPRPVADQAALRHLHGRQIGGLDRLGARFGKRLAFGLRAFGVRRVLVQSVDLGDALVAERRLHDRSGLGVEFLGRRRARATDDEARGKRRENEGTSSDDRHSRLRFHRLIDGAIDSAPLAFTPM
jgi:hypothetical protein